MIRAIKKITVILLVAGSLSAAYAGAPVFVFLQFQKPSPADFTYATTTSSGGECYDSSYGTYGYAIQGYNKGYTPYFQTPVSENASLCPTAKINWVINSANYNVCLSNNISQSNLEQAQVSSITAPTTSSFALTYTAEGNNGAAVQFGVTSQYVRLCPTVFYNNATEYLVGCADDPNDPTNMTISCCYSSDKSSTSCNFPS